MQPCNIWASRWAENCESCPALQSQAAAWWDILSFNFCAINFTINGDISISYYGPVISPLTVPHIVPHPRIPEAVSACRLQVGAMFDFL